MKQVVVILSFFCFTFISAQSEEEMAVRKTVDAFFESFHAQDSLGLKKVVSPEVILQTIGAGKDGVQRIRTDKFDDLIRSITSIPDSVDFQEKLLDYTIQIDGAMANAWTPYEFWLNDTFHHCGVNSFQLFKEENDWKIIYLVDTRRREGCEKQ